jgi:hypothetical protein
LRAQLTPRFALMMTVQEKLLQTELVRIPPKTNLEIPKLEPEMARPWEGEFHATFPKTGNTYIVPIKAVITLAASIIEGRGRSLSYPTHGSDADRMFEITGTHAFGKVAFQCWFAGINAHLPWSCEGEVNGARDYILGTWSMDCLRPSTCGCGGPSGPFELKQCK